MSGRNPSYVAGETITTSRFLKFESGTDHTVLLCGDAEQVCGVSHEGTREAPIPGVTPAHALDGEPVMSYGLGDVCEVIAGGTIAAGDFLASDANAAAVPAATGEYYGGVAQTDAVSGERVRIQVMFGQLD